MASSNDSSSHLTRSIAALPKKTFRKYRKPLVEHPNLVEAQLASFRQFTTEGLKNLFQEFRVIEDYGGGRKFRLEFSEIELGKPSCHEYYAKENQLTYQAPLRARVKLTNRQLGTTKEQEMFLGDLPLMTNHGTFIVNGVERVIVPQLVRSYGVFFTMEYSRELKKIFGAKIIPLRGAWVEIETERVKDDAFVIFVKIDRHRRLPITQLLRVLGAEHNEALFALAADNARARAALRATMELDAARTVDEAAVEIYKRLRDSEPPTPAHAKELVCGLFASERYDISYVGRFRFNQRFGLPMDEKALKEQSLTLLDFGAIVRHLADLYADPHAEGDDIDHLGFRRVRFVGELLEQRLRVGLARMKRNVQDRMSTIESDTTQVVQLLNPRPFAAAIREFFTSNQLSQLAQQQNILTEMEHLRSLSALGPGGLTRERAGFEVRDVHPSHYGRLCPIHTPEGPNIGLILHLATYGTVDKFGSILTPFARVEGGKVTGEIVYLNAHQEEEHNVAHAATPVDEKGNIIPHMVEVRFRGAPCMVPRKEVHYMDVATYQPWSVATSLIPFLENDDSNRALMGSNMQKQATPLLRPEAPLVATGFEASVARDSGRLVIAEEDGEIVAVDARSITLLTKKGERRTYPLLNFHRTNDKSCLHHRPIVSKGHKVKRGDVLADTLSTDRGQLALGHNVRVAFMSWYGANYEDAIVISERLVQDAKYASIYIEDFECVVRETKLGPEVTTHDIPNVGEHRLRNLDEDGIVRVGAEVEPGDILVGKVTPKGESQLTPEERLLRSIFGEQAKEVKDTSLRLEGGKRGRVIGVRVFSREAGYQLESGVLKKVVVTIAQVRPISVGDKLAGRHGNKGVISLILPVEDMPYDENGEPVDVVLTPLGVPSRMNLGQILEMHLGLAAGTLGYQAIVPPFQGATEEEIQEELKVAGFSENGKIRLFDGRTGEPFAQPVAVGMMYIMKLHHMVEDKIHMRSVGPYSLITQQPLGGKARHGGQRFGEMEVWALLGYGAAYTLREMLTIKSDDIQGRTAAFDAIVKGKPIVMQNTPAAFSVLINHLRGLALEVVPLSKSHGDGAAHAETAAPQSSMVISELPNDN